LSGGEAWVAWKALEVPGRLGLFAIKGHVTYTSRPRIAFGLEENIELSPVSVPELISAC